MRNIAPDKVAEYTAFMNDAGKKFSQSRIASGEIKGWLHLQLTGILTSTAGFNYVTVATTDKPPELVIPPGAWDAHAKKAGFNTAAEYGAKMRSFGPMVRQEVTRVRNRLGDANVGDFIRVAYNTIAADHLNERLAWLNEYAAPLNQMRIQDPNGAVRGWGVSTIVLPAGEEATYTYSTSVVLKNSAAVVQGPGPMSEADFKKAHPNKNFNTYVIANTRWQSMQKLEKVRVYKVLDKVGGLPQVSQR